MSNPQRFAHNPEKVRVKTICLDWRFIFMRRDIAAFDENLLSKRDTDRISRDGWTVLPRAPTLDRSDYRRFVCRRKHQLVAHGQGSCLDGAGNNPTPVKAVDILNAKAKWKVNIAPLRLQQIKRFENIRRAVPFHLHAGPRDILTFLRRRRNKSPRVQSKFAKKLAIFLLDLTKSFF